MDQPYDNYNYAPGYTGAEDTVGLAFLGALAVFTVFFVVIFYVVNAIFLMKLLKNAGHRAPGSAWVPIWNQVSLAEIGGIKQPWIWMLIIFAGSFVAGLIPVIGFILSLVLLAASIILMVYIAKGVQAGLGIDSIGGIVLAVVVPLAWIIWMAIASGKRNYDKNAALQEGATFPMNWFGESDRLAPFGASSNFYSYSQQNNGGTPSPAWQQPQGKQPYSAPGAQGSWNPSTPPQQGYEQAQAPTYQPPQAPEAPRGYEPPRDFRPEDDGNGRSEDGLPRI